MLPYKHVTVAGAPGGTRELRALHHCCAFFELLHAIKLDCNFHSSLCIRTESYSRVYCVGPIRTQGQAPLGQTRHGSAQATVTQTLYTYSSRREAPEKLPRDENDGRMTKPLENRAGEKSRRNEADKRQATTQAYCN